ncbi:MAG: hypothetical protein AMQ74_01140 [Candidatus Methanofastidiosum methylothiophilum]|jgi:hypothetical protein|uniref:Uncharacterized protein n=1 Tax=Candidatus Methanofastidiosum methylothiophilum TaxID=1705564 RepID=A0A150J2J0_9EURY|nr:MAG: hypothetical protein AMQ74_01140 [Candidatus Methanofastidiosum methylthiophilus]NMC76489.1 hypothetical protein [Candidatus Methanofastidiosa archaeon]
MTIILKTGFIAYRQNSVRPGLRPKKGDGILFGIIIGIVIGIFISTVFNHFVFVIIGIAFGHYIGLIIESLACPTSSSEIVSYRKYSLVGTIAAIASILYAALSIE